MARYFKYKTPQALADEAVRLGGSLLLSERLEPLFEPISIGGRVCGNRLAIHPMEGCDGTLDGKPDELTFRRYRRFGAGGAKLIWGEATAVSDEGRMNPRQLWLHEGSAAAIEIMLANCRNAHREAFGSDHDLLLGLQLTHSGRYGYRGALLATHDPVLDPLTIDKQTRRTIDASFPVLSDDALKGIGDQYVAAARWAARIGADFVDIKQCHRYLLSELLAAKNREGNYGGSLANRTRLVREIIERIRSEVPALIIASRFNAYDGIPYWGGAAGEVGRPCPHELPLVCAFGTAEQDHLVEAVSEPVELASSLQRWGVDLFSVSAGNPYANPHVVRPADYAPADGYEPPEHPLVGVMRLFRLSQAIASAVPQVPVVGGGYSWLQEFALQAAAGHVGHGRVALVGLGRAALSQPDFARQIRQTGTLDRKRTCRTFSYCTNLMRSKRHPLGQFPTGCPPFDKEVYGPLWEQAQRSSELT